MYRITIFRSLSLVEILITIITSERRLMRVWKNDRVTLCVGSRPSECMPIT